MTIALVVLAALLTAVSIGSGFAKFKKVPQVMESMAAVGVKPNQIPILATLEIAGGLGLIAGIWISPLGLAAAIGLALYFGGAVAMHLKSKHSSKEFGPALGIFFIAVAVTVLELSR